MNFTPDEISAFIRAASDYDVDHECRVLDLESATRLLAAAFALRPVPQWISYDKQPPTFEDGDSCGEVLLMNRKGQIGVEEATWIQEGDYWMRCADVAALPKKE